MTERDEQMTEHVRQQAADWFIANRESLDAGQEMAFIRWLRESPGHVQEYLGMALTARDLSAAAAGSSAPIELLVQRAQGPTVETLRLSQYRRTARRAAPVWRFAVVPMALAGVLAVGLAWWAQNYGAESRGSKVLARAHYETQHGQRRTWHLYDGSTVHLNTDTAVTLDFSALARRITIERGQATFEVAHDPQRSFRVITPATEVVAVGTTFDVYMRQDATLVTVVAGRVSVAPGRAQRTRVRELDSGPVLVSEGQQFRVPVGVWPGTLNRVDAGQATAWLRGRITFSQQPLGDLAAEFNRYAAAPIVIETAALRALPVSGTFAVEDTGAFVAFLRSLQGTHVEVTPERTRVWQ